MAEALRSGPAPWKSPPTATAPPPISPATSILAPSNSPTLSPSTLTVPPVWPAPLPDASSVPATWTIPASPPSSTISPLVVPTERAWAMPSMLIMLVTMVLAALAVRMMVPPSAEMVPELSTRAFNWLPSAPSTWLRTLSPGASLISLSP